MADKALGESSGGAPLVKPQYMGQPVPLARPSAPLSPRRKPSVPKRPSGKPRGLKSTDG